MSKAPIVYMAYAEAGAAEAYRTQQIREQRRLRGALEDSYRKGRIRLEIRTGLLLADLLSDLEWMKDELAVFHFSVVGDGLDRFWENPETVEALVGMVEQAPGLKLLYLNSPFPDEIITRLREAGISAIISGNSRDFNAATSAAIISIAEILYKGLANEKVLLEAFKEAEGYYYGIYGSNVAPFPLNLYVREEDYTQWTIGTPPPAVAIDSDDDSQNTARIDGQGNIVVQGSNNVTINVNDPNLDKTLQEQGQTIQNIKQLFLGQIMETGQLGDGLEQLLKRYPEPEDIPFLLRKGSQNYFQLLTASDGRFGHLGTEDPSQGYKPLAGLAESILTRPLDPDQDLYSCLRDFWTADQNRSRHVLLRGETGMGKTVNLIWLWNKLLDEEGTTHAIPVYLALSEYNNAADKEQFVLRQILRQYLGERRKHSELEDALWKWLEQDWNEAYPKVLLMLDGWNEISVNKSQLRQALDQDWLRKVSGVQLLISSREDIKSSVPAFSDFKALELSPLNEESIHQYLTDTKQQSKIPTEQRMIDLLSRPMMLSLYADSLLWGISDIRFHFKEQVNSGGELIWNFVETKLLRLFETGEAESQNNAYFHFLNKHLLSYIAYKMERGGWLEISETGLEEIVKEGFEIYGQADYFARYHAYRPYIKLYRKHLRQFKLGSLSWLETIVRYEEILEVFRLELFPFNQKEEQLHFLHQSFRDFYAAMYILGEIRMALERGEIAEVLQERPIPEAIRRMMGEIEGEHYNQPHPKGENWSTSHYQPTIFTEVLDLCRGQMDADRPRYAVWNILMIWKDVRGELTGADLSHLDLQDIALHDVVFGRQKVGSRWEGARISPRQFLQQGHDGVINQVLFSPDNELIASASDDGSVKLWSTRSRNCQYTLSGHRKGVLQIAFVSGGRELLSVGIDQMIKRWSIDSGQCLSTSIGPGVEPNNVKIQPDGEQLAYWTKERGLRLWSVRKGQDNQNPLPSDQSFPAALTYSADGQWLAFSDLDQGYKPVIRLWSIDQQQIVREFYGHRRKINALTFSREARLLVSVSADDTIRGWSLEPHLWATGQEQIFILGKALGKIRSAGTENSVLQPEKQERKNHWQSIAISPDNQYLASGSVSNLIGIWSLQSGSMLHQLTGHTVGPVSSLEFNAGSTELISGSGDYSLRLWSIKTGACLHVFAGKRAQKQGLNLIGNDLSEVSWTETLTAEQQDFLSDRGANLGHPSNQ